MRRGDTIVALSSAPGASPRGVIRLSGPNAWDLAASVFTPSSPWRRARRLPGALRLPGWPPAAGAALAFRGPRSVTGEDLVELWLPGAPPLLRRTILTLEERGARHARRGEFTRRAFHNGRLDLTQAEAVLTLTTQEDARQAQGALRALQGGLGEAIDVVKESLLRLSAELEAAIDFSDEDITLTAPERLAQRSDAAAAALAQVRGRGARALRASGADPVVALRGPANAGKSTLFNALTGGEGALVADVAGTTRDVLAGTWRLAEDASVTVLDTAGDVLAHADEVERAAASLAADAGRGADLVLWVVDAPRAAEGRAGFAGLEVPALWVTTKTDLAPGGSEGLAVSVARGEGLEALRAQVHRALFEGTVEHGAELVGTARQEGLLRQAEEALERASELLRSDDPARAELSAWEVTEALDALGALTGVVTHEDVLDRLFGAFCIGK